VLFRIEVLSALSRRREPDELLDAVDALTSGPRFHVAALDRPLLERATAIARQARVRAYDAVYAALALEREASLMTLDVDVCVKLRAAFPEVALVALPR
jgi:predicted nucleic acid-binding protein